MESPVTCTGVADELLAYHLDLVEDDTRQAIDAHLLGCQDCLRAFLQLKHQARGAGRRANWKKAIVTLQPDQKIELFEQI